MSKSDESFEEDRIQGPRQRVFRPSAVVTDPTQFRERFRLTSRQADVLLGVIGEQLQPSTFRSNPMSPKEKLLCALQFYASNSLFYNVGDAQGPSKKSADRAIRQVTSVINAKFRIVSSGQRMKMYVVDVMRPRVVNVVRTPLLMF